MTFRPMLACKAEFSKIKYPVFASPKLDGIRATVVDGKLLSRTLKPIPNRHIYSQLSNDKLEGLDGELIVGSPTSKTCYTDSVSNVMAHDKMPNYTYYVFDDHSNPTATYRFRRERLLDNFNGWINSPQICLLEQNLISCEDDLLAYEATKVAEGYEGVIIRNPCAKYKFGRSTVNEGALIKIKRFEDSEAEIIGFDEEMLNGNEAQTNELGRTKRSTAAQGLVGKQTLGAFRVRDCVSGVEFSVGTGLTAAERQQFWNRQDDFRGKILKYKFFAVGVKVAPRHPVFLGMRDARDM